MISFLSPNLEPEALKLTGTVQHLTNEKKEKEKGGETVENFVK